MKTIIMAPTVPLLCKSQEEIQQLLNDGWKIKKLKDGSEYLIKEEN